MDNALRLAPMMGYTSAPFRLLLKLLAPTTQLYTEMVSVNAVIYNPQTHYFSRFLQEDNTVFQIGGDHPVNSTEVAKQAEQAGFSEININCGCPSNRVQNANFGACLMSQPERVAEMFQHMQEAVTIPVSVKHRLGIDKMIDYDFVYHFVNTLYEAGCRRIIVHARNAWLSGLSPRLNRKVPPLRPQFVYQLKHDFPDMNICINGEINTLEKIINSLSESQEYKGVFLDAVMIGRKAWDNPYLFAIAEKHFHQGDNDGIAMTLPVAQKIIEQYFAIMQSNYSWSKNIWSVNTIIRPLTHLFSGVKNAKKWRSAVSASYKNLDEAEFALLALSREMENGENKYE